MAFPPIDPKPAKAVTIVSLLVAGILSVAVSAFFLSRSDTPVIERIRPNVASKGEMIVIEGRNFGSERGDSAVDVSGTVPTQSHILSWSDTEIRIKVPETAGSGLVRVVSRGGKSNGMPYTDRDTIPVRFADEMSQSEPFIIRTDPPSAPVGGLVTITGINFGASRADSSILFSWYGESSPRAVETDEFRLFVSGSPSEYPCDSWTDKEIKARVPDGAVSGLLSVRTEKGLSNPVAFEVAQKPGAKSYRDEKTYVLESRVEASSIKARAGSDFYFWIPRPLESSSQRGVRVLSRSDIPVLERFSGTDLFHYRTGSGTPSYRVDQTFLAHVFSVECKVDPDRIRQGEPSPLELAYVKPDSLVPSDKPDIAKAAKEIAGNEKNPWRIARRIYDWMAGSFSWVDGLHQASVPDALKARKGDAWNAALLAVALLRSQGIPAAPMAGYLVEPSMAVRRHYWVEFWISGFGWVPFDSVLASGAKPAVMPPREDQESFYFGNLDNRHLAFSRGAVELVPVISGGRTVARNRFYSFQRLYEETSPSVVSYSALWNDIVVSGMY